MRFLELKYKPGTTSITCEYCGHEEAISLDENGFQELELYPYFEEMGAQKHSEEISMLHCKNCGADQHVEENYKSLHCVYCGQPLMRNYTPPTLVNGVSIITKPKGSGIPMAKW